MQILALETSTEYGTCALWRDGQVSERACPAGRPHSETLLPLVGEMLAAAGASLRSLDAVAFGAGPGAFTGLRIACGIAQGLAVGADLPVVPVGTLDALAADCPGERVVALLDARMNEVYGACYERRDGRLERRGEIVVAPPENIFLPSDGGWIAAGNALAAYPSLAARVAAAGWPQLPQALPGAARVAELAAVAVAEGRTVDAALAAPLYVRDKVARTVAERLAEGGRP